MLYRIQHERQPPVEPSPVEPPHVQLAFNLEHGPHGGAGAAWADAHTRRPTQGQLFAPVTEVTLQRFRSLFEKADVPGRADTPTLKRILRKDLETLRFMHQGSNITLQNFALVLNEGGCCVFPSLVVACPPPPRTPGTYSKIRVRRSLHDLFIS